MKSAVSRTRKIEAEIRRSDARKRQIDELQRAESEGAKLIADETEALVVDLAKNRGILGLPPDRIVALFEHLPESGAPDKSIPAAGEDGSLEGEEAAGGLLNAGMVSNVTIKFGNNKNSQKVALLKRVGLTRNGKRGDWHGQVDPETFALLRETFGGRLQKQSTSPAAESSSEMDGASDSEGGAKSGAVRPTEGDLAAQDTTVPLALDGSKSTEAHGSPSPEQTKSSSTYRGPFLGMPRRGQAAKPE
jgi:hypothetical protein